MLEKDAKIRHGRTTNEWVRKGQRGDDTAVQRCSAILPLVRFSITFIPPCALWGWGSWARELRECRD